jgi:hypothetical protein
MTKFVFWNILYKNISIALDEPLTHYARGDTFWQAISGLLEICRGCRPSPAAEESDLPARLKMYDEIGINKIEIFVDKAGDKFAVRCANSRSLLDAATELEALQKYVAVRGKTSLVNVGDPQAL